MLQGTAKAAWSGLWMCLFYCVLRCMTSCRCVVEKCCGDVGTVGEGRWRTCHGFVELECDCTKYCACYVQNAFCNTLKEQTSDGFMATAAKKWTTKELWCGGNAARTIWNVRRDLRDCLARLWTVAVTSRQTTLRYAFGKRPLACGRMAYDTSFCNTKSRRNTSSTSGARW